ncbi:sensor histidine kinase [Actinophytocola xinjiangensis]|uniref:sensor histidine kinase n=1 Tax=Actinophytocola xinjiangensis TaxID=485602 RepID=UPI001FECB1B0|nr:ATP-binding protein [Actinophytocola xinjiangensis]
MTLLAIGVGFAGFLTFEGYEVRDEAVELREAIEPAIEFAEVLQEERRLSMMLLAGDRSVTDGLTGARERVDQLLSSGALLAAQENALSGGSTDDQDTAIAAFAQVRGGVDAGAAPPDQIYGFYNQIVDRILNASRSLAGNMPDAESAADGAMTVELFEAAESMSRGNALALVAAGDMTAERLHEYSRQVGSYQSTLNSVGPLLREADRARLDALRASPEWQRLTGVENALLERGVGRGTDALPVSRADWQDAAATVGTELIELWRSQNTAVVDSAVDSGERTATGWLIAGIAMLVAALVASVVTLRISGRLISRLRRLRSETLTLADERLPDIITRLRSGEQVDVTTEIQPLDFGGDEIGEVAEAFNHAESSAVAAAVTEARTRDGVNALFLNIAHRSQIVVHRQLELLDHAEHGEEDPRRLELLFKLDHLATRARRNAENLIILGGEQPGRQWRNPVPLVELVRSAIAETEDYARVLTGQLANVSIVGNVVADLIHLLAELVENATSFSPPESRVEVAGNVVGRGVAVEVVDQGLGMTEEHLDQLNELLTRPPDFSATTLSSDSRMGLLVVGQIAARNGVTVRLTESAYGGVRAIVLIPTDLTVRSEVNGVRPDHTTPPPRRHRAPAVEWPTEEPPAPRHAQVPAVAQDTRTERVERAAPPPPAPAAAEPAPTTGRPELPRRRRQANLAPQLSTSPPSAPTQPSTQPSTRRERSPASSRDLFSAIESGTRRGRTRPDPGRPTP